MTTQAPCPATHFQALQGYDVRISSTFFITGGHRVMSLIDDITNNELIAVAQDWLERAGAPGATIALMVDGEPWSQGVGFADLVCTLPLAADAPFGLYSITKVLISTMVLQMAEGEDSLSLDDILQQRLPEFPIERPILLRQVLNHTGGLPDYGADPAYHAAIQRHPETPWSRGHFLAATLDDQLLYMPGHGWRYSNIGYMLLRQVLEEESGLPLPHLLRHLLVNRFDLSTLGVASSLGDMSALTPGFSTLFQPAGPPEDIRSRYHPGWVAHGLATGTAADVARFTWLLLGAQTIVDPTLVNDMLIGAPVAADHRWLTRPGYGLGLMVGPGHRFGTVAGHAGGGPGYSTATFHFPDVHGHQVTAVALVNRDGDDTASGIVFSLAEILAARLKHIAPPHQPATS